MSSTDGGKGSRARPFSVSQDEFDQRWQAIFGHDQSSNNSQSQEDLSQFLDESRALFEEFEQDLIRRSEELWNQLTLDQQLLAFCYVCRKITQANEENRSYRGTLYDVFGFDLDSYTAAQSSGFLKIHNCLPNNTQRQK